MKILLLTIIGLVSFVSVFSQADSTLLSRRPDGRLSSTYAVLHQMLKDANPRWQYREGMTKGEFKRWQKGLRQAMAEIMKWPKIDKSQPLPKKISQEQCDGYVSEHWEAYPLKGVVIPFIVMRPDGAKGKRIPGILCLPGSGQTMENLSKGMGLSYVKEGWIAVCVDNASAGEQADQENKYPDSWDYDYVLSSRMLLELGWSWLGYTSFMDYHILQWMKTDQDIDNHNIVVSGFSLGTEPMMVIGVMDKDIKAFVYNDFLCNTQERALSITALDKRGRRHFPNSIRHLIPDYWNMFNFADVVASLAPRPIILTEGGLDRDFNKVRSAYKTAGNPQGATCIHYLKYQNDSMRVDYQTLPEGLDNEHYLPMVNVDPGHHYFKKEYIIPWLKDLLNKH